MRIDDPDFTKFTETSEKRAQIQKWLSRHAKRLTAVSATGAAVLTLPAMALAQAGEQFVLLRSIDGVTQVNKQADGSLQIEASNGQTINVNAQDVRILQNGEIAISQNAAAVVAEAAGAGLASVGTLAAVGGGLAATGAAVAIADDGSSSSAPAPKTLNLADALGSGLSSESTGYVAPEDTTALTVTIDGKSYEATLGAEGAWTLPLTPAQAAEVAQGQQTAQISAKDSGGDEIGSSSARFDIDTLPPSLALNDLPVGAVMNTAERGADLIVTGTTNAENGQTVTVTLNGKDYTGNVSDGTFSVTVPSADLAELADGAAVTLAANVSDAAGNPATSVSAGFATDFAAPVVALDTIAGGSLDLGDVQGDLTITGTTTAEDGQVVTVTFDGTDYTGAAAGGVFSVTLPQAALQAIVDRPGDTASVEVSAAVSDAAGNAATPATVTVPGDFSAPSITIGTIAGDDALNAGETGADVTVSGGSTNVLAGQTVTVTAAGKTYTGTTDASGNWSVTIPAADVGAFADGNVSVTADVSQDGIAAPQASKSVTVDTAAPTIAIDALPIGASMNAAEQATDLTITGTTTAENGQIVTVAVNGTDYTGTANGGVFSVTVPAASLAALPDGASVAVTANVSDAAGNPAPQAGASFATDFSAPSLNFTDLPAPGEVVNAADLSVNGTLEGTTNAEDGAAVRMQITASDGTVVFDKSGTVSSGAFSVPTTPAELSVLQDGQTYTLSATVTDLAGNATSQSGSFATDLTAPTLAFDAPPSGGTLTLNEAAAGDLVVTGTSTAEDGQVVTLVVAGKGYTAPVDGGAWSISVPSADVQALTDGTTVPFSISVADAAGNPASATSNVVIDYAPILTLNTVGTNGAVYLEDVQGGGLTLNGTALGVADGTTINVAVGGTTVGSATAASGAWSITLPSATFSGAKAEEDLDISISSPGATPAAQTVVLYEDPAYFIQEISSDGAQTTYGLFLSPGTDVSGGVAVTATVEFDPTVFDYGAASGLSGSLFAPNESGADAGKVVFGLVAVTAPSDLSQPVITFTGTVLDASKPFGFEITTPEGGSSDSGFGTAGADVIAAGSIGDIFTIIRAGGGNDSIDLAAAAPKLILFEADPAANGIDTIANFTGGQTDGLGDLVSFVGLTPADLRGDGTGFETLASNGVLGANTGIVNFTTQLGGLSATDLADAAETLQGEAAGDAFYIFASNGTDAALAKITFAAPDDASADIMATFTGITNTAGFNDDSIIFPELSAAYT